MPVGATAVPDRRMLGATELSVSAMGMGCARLGAFWQGRSPSAGLGAVREARSRGINFFDTADCYARGISERIIGRALRSDRRNVILSTKVGLLKTPLAIASAARTSPPVGRRVLAALAAQTGMAPMAHAASCYSPSYVVKAVDRSLRRLETHYVDLLLLHEPSVEVLERQDFLPALVYLQQAGKIRHFGVSCASEEVASTALTVPGIACLQVRHNMAHSHVVPNILPRAVRSGVGLVAVAPFGDGSLLATGGPERDLDPSNLAEQCLQFCLTTPGISSVLVGMTSRRHVSANADVACSTRGGRNAQDGEARAH